MGPTITDWIQAGAAIAMMVAAIAAAVIAWKVPRLAAQYAEEYRRETASADELRQFQTWVFRALMKGRAEMLSSDTRAAINLVEAAFTKDPKVRGARRSFTKAANTLPYDEKLIVEAYLALVEAVSCAAGYGDHIDRFDIESGYYPRAMGLLDEAALAEAAAKIAAHRQA